QGCLLQPVPAYTPAALLAQTKLEARLREHEAEIINRYGRVHAPTPDEYWIHDAKFLPTLLDYLKQKSLAWPSSHSKAYGNRNWFALHPILGSAVMTAIGLSIAREQQYDIVTPSERYHEML